MPGIIYTPGYDWPVRDLAEFTRPLVWPQPRKSLGRRNTDQFQTKWSEPALRTPGTYEIDQEQRTYRRLTVGSPPGGSFISVLPASFPTAAENARLIGARYHADETYAASNVDSNSFEFEAEDVVVDTDPVVDLTFYVEAGDAGANWRVDKEIWIKKPSLTTSLVGWPVGVTSENLSIADADLLLKGESHAEASNAAAGYPLTWDDVYTYYVGNYNPKAYYEDEAGNDVYEEISMGLLVRYHIYYTYVDGYTLPATPSIEYIDLSSYSTTQSLYDKSESMPALTPATVPAWSRYQRTCRNFGGMVLA